MKTLLIYYNPWVLSLQMTVAKQLGIEVKYATPSRNYFDSGSQMFAATRFLKTHTKFIVQSYENLDNDYDCIIIPSPGCTCEDEIYAKYTNVKFIFVEEGVSAYLERPLTETESSVLSHSQLFLTRPDKRQSSYVNANEAAKYAQELLHDELKGFPQLVSRVFFTSPMAHDQGDMDYQQKVENYINSIPENETVLLKRHPRDDTKYKFTRRVLECEREIPGQMLYFKYPNATFVFSQYSTLLLLIPDKLNKILL